MFPTKMTDQYPEGYWERAEGSNYRCYSDDSGWEQVLDVIQKYAPPPAVVREVACSKGYFVLHAMQRGYNVRGCDISTYAISAAPDEVKPYVVVANATDLPWESDSADVVTHMEFLEHVPEDEVGRVIEEMTRVLKAGGLLVGKIGIAIPDDHPFKGQPDHDHTHVTMRSRTWWEAHFAQVGLWAQKNAESDLDSAFAERDWYGRFFVWRKPTT
jgi:SAM-dependent methyltransferase